jgi:hypothetical protein
MSAEELDTLGGTFGEAFYILARVKRQQEQTRSANKGQRPIAGESQHHDSSKALPLSQDANSLVAQNAPDGIDLFGPEFPSEPLHGVPSARSMPQFAGTNSRDDVHLHTEKIPDPLSLPPDTPSYLQTSSPLNENAEPVSSGPLFSETSTVMYQEGHDPGAPTSVLDGEMHRPFVSLPDLQITTPPLDWASTINLGADLHSLEDTPSTELGKSPGLNASYDFRTATGFGDELYEIPSCVNAETFGTYSPGFWNQLPDLSEFDFGESLVSHQAVEGLQAGISVVTSERHPPPLSQPKGLSDPSHGLGFGQVPTQNAPRTYVNIVSKPLYIAKRPAEGGTFDANGLTVSTTEQPLSKRRLLDDVKREQTHSLRASRSICIKCKVMRVRVSLSSSYGGQSIS